MAVLIENNQESHKIQKKRIQRLAQAALNALDCPEGELSILIMDDPGIAELNERYLHREGPTNVIAFAMREGDYTDITPELLGDVVISADTAAREAEAGGVAFEERLTWLLVHGVLHLFGYDHEQSPEMEREMEAKSEEVLGKIERESEL
ncbi:MAG: rRNA maturation RNase YbeY [Desulfobacterales bacterium]|nr:rRNA maturation RNase YbeY [Desulfobacterales bacterium]